MRRVVSRGDVAAEYTVVDIEFIEEASEEAIGSVEFLPGMVVVDETVGLGKRVIWGDGEPGLVLTLEEYKDYVNGRSGPLLDAVAVPGRRDSSAGFWTFNASVAVVVASLYWLRRRFRE